MIVFRRYIADRRRSAMWWTIGVTVLMFVTAAVYPALRNQPSLDDLLNDLPAGLRAVVGAQAGIALTSPQGYLHARLFALLLPALMVIFAVGYGSRAIGASEDDGTLEIVLANPITRSRVAAERFAAMAVSVVGLGAVATVLLFVLAPLFGLLDGLSILHLLLAVAATTCLALLHGSIAFAVGCVFGGRTRSLAVAACTAVAGYLINTFAAAGVLEPLRFVSPWYWDLSRNVLASGVGAEAILLPLVLSAGLVAAGIRAFERRDLR